MPYLSHGGRYGLAVVSGPLGGLQFGTKVVGRMSPLAWDSSQSVEVINSEGGEISG